MTDLELFSQLEDELKIRFCPVGTPHRYVQGYIANGNKIITICLNKLGLKKIPNTIYKFKNLKNLYLCDNNITELSEDILQLQIPFKAIGGNRDEIGIHIDNNKIESPPLEIVLKDLKGLKNYFNEVKQSEVDFIYELKLLIVGEGRVGKTSIQKSITIPEYELEDEQSTEGIDIRKWIIPKSEFKHLLRPIEYRNVKKDYRINVWDFGGQEIYHSTHQFFLTKRSVYLLVTESRKEDKPEDFYYWLNLIEVLGGTSPQIVVLNKCDQPTKEIPINDYKKQFKNIIGNLISVSCLPSYKSTIENLKDTIKRIITNNQLLPHIGTPLPKAWIDIRQELEDYKMKGKKHISLDEYINLCKPYFTEKNDNMPDKLNSLEERALYLSDYLHDIGAILHFQNDFILRDTVFLDNEWVTNAVYRILDNKEVIKNKGVFSNNDILQIWCEKEYYNKRTELLSLMKNSKFDICFQIDKDKYLAPQLLGISSIDYSWNYDSEQFYYEFIYEFMPKGILSRFIVKLHNLIVDHKYWRYGVIIEYRSTEALILEHYYQRKISIQITGENRIALFEIIRKTLNDIHNDFVGLQINERLPCICPFCKKQEKPFLFELDNLNMRLSRNREKIECDYSYNLVSVKDILRNSNQINESKLVMRNKIFISYSHANKTFLALIQKHLMILNSMGVDIEYWDDTRILAGMKWKEEINSALAATKVGILLITNDFLASDFIRNSELPSLLKSAEDEGAVIIPINIEYSLVDQFEQISQFQALNAPEHPLADLSKNEQEKVLSQLVRRLKTIINNG